MYNSIPAVMTFKECQKLLRVGKNTLLSMLHSGEIEAFKIGSRWRITRDSIIDYLKYK